jgi:hypothetical protein
MIVWKQLRILALVPGIAIGLACATQRPASLEPGMTKQEATRASGLDFSATRPNFRVKSPQASYEEYFMCAAALGGWYITMYPWCGDETAATRVTFVDGRVESITQ